MTVHHVAERCSHMKHALWPTNSILIVSYNTSDNHTTDSSQTVRVMSTSESKLHALSQEQGWSPNSVQWQFLSIYFLISHFNHTSQRSDFIIWSVNEFLPLVTVTFNIHKMVTMNMNFSVDVQPWTVLWWQTAARSADELYIRGWLSGDTEMF